MFGCKNQSQTDNLAYRYQRQIFSFSHIHPICTYIPYWVTRNCSTKMECKSGKSSFEKEIKWYNVSSREHLGAQWSLINFFQILFYFFWILWLMISTYFVSKCLIISWMTFKRTIKIKWISINWIWFNTTLHYFLGMGFLHYTYFGHNTASVLLNCERSISLHIVVTNYFMKNVTIEYH